MLKSLPGNPSKIRLPAYPYSVCIKFLCHEGFSFQSILREKSLKPKAYLAKDIERHVPDIAREEGADEEEVKHLGPYKCYLGIP